MLDTLKVALNRSLLWLLPGNAATVADKTIVVHVAHLPFGALAITVYPWIFYADKDAPADEAGRTGLQRHELHHWRQQRAYGMLAWMTAYLVFEAIRRVTRQPNHMHPLEEAPTMIWPGYPEEDK